MIWYPSFYIFLFFLTYSILRYVLLGPVEASEIPLYISNKAFAWCSLTLILITIYARPGSPGYSSRAITAILFLLLHLLSSLMLLNSHYYPSFFQEDALGWAAQISLLAAIIATVLLLPATLFNLIKLFGFTREHSNVQFRNLGLIIIILSMVHLVFYAYQNWFTPSKWYGYLPPISLICFIQILITYASKKIKSTSKNA